MADSPILKIPLISPTQNNKSTTHNDGIAALEQAMNAPFLSNVVDGADITLSEDDYTRNAVFTFEGATGDKNIKLPSTINSVNTTLRVFVLNLTSHVLTFKATTGSGTTVVLQPNRSAFIYQNHEDITLLALLDTVSSLGSYDVATWYPGTFTSSQIVVRIIAARPFDIPNDFAGSKALMATPPGSDQTFLVKKNGTQFGTLVIDHTTGAGTFLTSGADEAFAAGDYIDIVAPSSPDGTMANLTFSILGSRT